MSYFVKQEKNREFTIEKDHQPIYKLTFPNWKCSNAVAQLSDGDYKFTKKSFWNSEYTLTRNDSVFGKITSNWKGHLLIHLVDDSGLVPSKMDGEMGKEAYRTYQIKTKGLFKQRHELYQNKDPAP